MHFIKNIIIFNNINGTGLFVSHSQPNLTVMYLVKYVSNKQVNFYTD